jgi:hypothetical protein
MKAISVVCWLFRNYGHLDYLNYQLQLFYLKYPKQKSVCRMLYRILNPKQDKKRQLFYLSDTNYSFLEI